MKTIQLKAHLTVEECKVLVGKKMSDEHYDLVIDDSTRLEDEQGNLLGVFVKKAITTKAAAKTYKGLLKFNTASNNRGTSTDGDKVGYRLRADGSRSKIRVSLDPKLAINGIIGYFDRSVRFPYCRQSAFTEKNPKEFAMCMDYFREASEVFRQVAPDAWARQKAIYDETSPDYKIKDTVFTTVTVNKNYQTACHLDAGDLKEGMSCLGVIRRGTLEGGLFVLPRYRVAIKLDTYDLAIINPHEFHGNTPIKKITAGAERLSLVLYYRTMMANCGSACEELERAKNRKEGDKIN